jgi:hypothetical protein
MTAMALQSGTMDVRELAPALLAVADLCERANTLVNGDTTSIVVNVRADFRRGSFQVHFDLVQASTIVSAVKAILFPHDLTEAKNLL